MSEHGLTREDPWIRRILAWGNERFPLANGILTFVLFTTALLFGRLVASADGVAVPIGLADLLPFFAYYGFFFMLRVFDEHKDYELDCHNHPERVLQSGLITLKDLKILGGFFESLCCCSVKPFAGFNIRLFHIITIIITYT